MTQNCTNCIISSELLKEIKILRQDNFHLTDNFSKFANQIKLYIKGMNQQNGNSADGLISIKDICTKLSITNATVHNWVKGEIIKKYKIGGRTYFDMNEVSGMLSKKGGNNYGK